MNNIVVLTIAGFDPSGGAGIQADLRTFEALGVVGISAITAITVQNSTGVKSVHAVEPDILKSQLDFLLSDIKVHAVKIGMLGGVPQVEGVAELLLKYRPPNIIVDPVLISTSGKRLLSIEGVEAMKRMLFPLSTLITPNLPELETLTGIKIDSQTSMDSAVRILNKISVQNVLVKGGHSEGDAIDTLYQSQGLPQTFHATRVVTKNTHGTGCLLSSAIAAYVAKGNALHDAVGLAKGTLSSALHTPVSIGHGNGYPHISRTI